MKNIGKLPVTELWFAALWLLATSLAMLLAMNMDTAAIVGGEYIPVGNDSLYHARRILDAAIGERGFYQFDDMIHVPQGSWITWPWAYDYLLAMALVVALKIDPTLEPMAFLARIPVSWIAVNAALTLLICRRMKLGFGLTAIAMLAFSLSPLVQGLHGLGRIDHHYVELTFTLAAVWLGVGYYQADASKANIIAFGAALAIAPAFHNGLFILQIPGLFVAFTMWLRGQQIAFDKVRTFALALVIGTLVILPPSEPFRELQFDFSTLSWFHLYVAVCTAMLSLFFARTTQLTIGRKFTWLSLMGLVMLLPLIYQFFAAMTILQGETVALTQVMEVKSPLRLYLDTGDTLDVTRFYSWLILLAPVLLAWFIYRIVRGGDSRDIAFAVYAAFGLTLLLMQFRLHPFGYWAIIIGPLVIIDASCRRLDWNRMGVIAACLAVVAIAYQPPLQRQLFAVFTPGNSADYAAGREMYAVLAEACEKDPGIVLAYSDDGHPIRYHTDCSVVANNFLLTPQHTEKFQVAGTLINMKPDQMISSAPGIKYVFARFSGIYHETPTGLQPKTVEELKENNVLLFTELLLSDETPASYELLGESRLGDERDIAFIRVYRINHDSGEAHQVAENDTN